MAVIFGKCNRHAFIQVITPTKSEYIEFDKSLYSERLKPFSVRIGANWADESGMFIDISGKKLQVKCELEFGKFERPRGDAMGVFRFLPFMQCRHRVISMGHLGQIVGGIRGELVYIEGDLGRGFPKKYLWTQAMNDEISIVAMCAVIPYLGLRFWGTICIIHFGGREYRIATYRGARVRTFLRDRLTVTQGHGRRKMVFEVYCPDVDKNMQTLYAPTKGGMGRETHESISTTVRYKLCVGGREVFDVECPTAAFEFGGL